MVLCGCFGTFFVKGTEMLSNRLSKIVRGTLSVGCWACGLTLILSGRGNMKSALPFGTFLALGAAFAAVLGPGLLTWYLGQF